MTLATYAATKAFLAALSRGLDNDEQYWGAPSGVRFEYISVGSVSTASNPQDVSFMRPSSPAFAKALVKSIGCGKRNYSPSLPHAILTWFVTLLPEKTMDNVAASMTKAAHEAKRKQK